MHTTTNGDRPHGSNAFNTIADFLSDEYTNSATPIHTPMSSPTALIHRGNRQPLTDMFPPENSYAMYISQPESMEYYLRKAMRFPSLEQLCALLSTYE
ncbi:hypothetical protein M413DRAFT_32092 [Hebeloma cylindrosporum]|uniref:Uncharacterized protein n=1 Tax=Hebeloma cylindrosporum TaxID=76867 RepID=A0A0C2XDG3_HEBCY|nr:hypothetical protein M413DRAFT_32092 [Hebeloma cylindrosporum h7]